MSLQTLIPIVLKASVLLTVFAIGLRASAHDATYLFRRPGELVRALLAMNLLMPVFAVLLISIFDLSPAVRIALVALSVSPIPPLLPNKLVKAGGTDSYAIGLLVAVGLLAIIFVPLAMEVIERVRNVPLQMTAASIVTLIFMTALLPLGLGVAVRSFAPALAERLAKPISLIAGVGLLVCVVAILFAAAPAIWKLLGNGTVIALAAFVLVGLAIGHSSVDQNRRIELRWLFPLLRVTRESQSPWPRRTFLSRNLRWRQCSYTCSSTQWYRSPIFCGPSAGDQMSRFR